MKALAKHLLEGVMALEESTPLQQSSQPLPWRGVVALGLLVASRPGLSAPTGYFPNVGHYAVWYVLLALSVGVGLSAARSTGRINRILGVPVVVVGALLCARTAWDCLAIIWR
jgi:hypothetical protein